MANEVNGLIGTFASSNPAFKGGYVYSAPALAGVAAANNYLALNNPTGSGKTIFLAGVFISSVTAGAVTALDPMRGWLATAISGGTLEAASTIGKMRSTMPNSAGEIRTGNPTATLGAAWFNSPTIQASGSASAPFVHQIPTTIAAGSITLLPGEGTVIRAESGDVDTRWNLSIAWSEI